MKAYIGIFGAPRNAPPRGHLTAVDLKTRKARDTGLFGSHLGITVKSGVPNLIDSIITASGLAYIAATTDQYLRAFHMRTGQVFGKHGCHRGRRRRR